MQTISFVEFRKHLSDYVGRARYADERIAVTHHGKIVGAFVSVETLKLLEELEEEEDRKAYDRAIRRHKKNKSKTISQDEMMQRLGLDV